MITTYDSNCMKCMNGAIHPWHDNGEPAEKMWPAEDARFSQLPPEAPGHVIVAGSPNVRKCRCSCHAT
jgi:hypothetical protein